MNHLNRQRYTLACRKVENIWIIEFAGFLTTGLTEVLAPEVDKGIAEGCRFFLFDFSGVTMLESPAVAALLTMTEKIVDEREGELAFCCLNEMAAKVLEMVGVFLYAGRFITAEEAIREMSA